ncbi:MAG: hypothetical protein U0T74_14010 [Chitinophagales bacterium]
MRKKSIIITLVIMVFAAACNNKKNEALTGIWKLKTMDVNGVSIQGEALGNWLWEFNDEGGYMINVAGAIEKGKYNYDGKKLILKSLTSKDRPEQTYNVVQLDSVSMLLSSVTDNNTSKLNFIKIDEGELGEKD